MTTIRPPARRRQPADLIQAQRLGNASAAVVWVRIRSEYSDSENLRGSKVQILAALAASPTRSGDADPSWSGGVTRQPGYAAALRTAGIATARVRVVAKAYAILHFWTGCLARRGKEQERSSWRIRFSLRSRASSCRSAVVSHVRPLIKGTAMTSLSTNPAVGTTTFNGKAVIKDVTNPLAPRRSTATRGCRSR